MAWAHHTFGARGFVICDISNKKSSAKRRKLSLRYSWVRIKEHLEFRLVMNVLWDRAAVEKRAVPRDFRLENRPPPQPPLPQSPLPQPSLPQPPVRVLQVLAGRWVGL